MFEFMFCFTGNLFGLSILTRDGGWAKRTGFGPVCLLGPSPIMDYSVFMAELDVSCICISTFASAFVVVFAFCIALFFQ